MHILNSKKTKGLIASLFLLFLLTGCGKTQETRLTRFKIYLFAPFTRPIGGEQTFSTEFVQENPEVLNEASSIITDGEIISYNWSTQKIELSEKYVAESQLHSSTHISDHSIFVVMFDDTPIVTGVSLLTVSPWAPKTDSILYLEVPLAEQAENPNFEMWLVKDCTGFTLDRCEHPFDKNIMQEIKEHFKSLGKLTIS